MNVRTSNKEKIDSNTDRAMVVVVVVVVVVVETCVGITIPSTTDTYDRVVVDSLEGRCHRTSTAKPQQTKDIPSTRRDQELPESPSYRSESLLLFHPDLSR